MLGEINLGKLKELINEYVRAPKGSPYEAELASEIEKISDWMMAQGYSDKPVQLPNKKGYGCRYFSKREPKCRNLPQGLYGYCLLHEGIMAHSSPSHFRYKKTAKGIEEYG